MDRLNSLSVKVGHSVWLMFSGAQRVNMSNHCQLSLVHCQFKKPRSQNPPKTFGALSIEHCALQHCTLSYLNYTILASLSP